MAQTLDTKCRVSQYDNESETKVNPLAEHTCALDDLSYDAMS